MILTESHIISESLELNDLTFKCKNLYNKANYIIRQEFISNGNFISKFNMFSSYNILRKVFPKAFSDGVEGVAVHPYRVNL